MRLKRIGLLGGTFDPIHNGHLELAIYAKKEYDLEKVIFIPSAEPPHKRETEITTFQHRLAMLSLAWQGMPGFENNQLEESLPKPSYTIDTIRELLKRYKGDYSFFFMLGADAFLDILTWKSYEHILETVEIILSGRKGYARSRLEKLLEYLGYTPCTDGFSSGWEGRHGKHVYLLTKTPGDYSSSNIRRRLQEGDPVNAFLPEAVRDYINRNNLYRKMER